MQALRQILGCSIECNKVATFFDFMVQLGDRQLTNNRYVMPGGELRSRKESNSVL